MEIRNYPLPSAKQCADCGKGIDPRSTYCPACEKVYRRRPVRLCPRCGIAPVGRRAIWCFACSYAMRGKRVGTPGGHCTSCGKGWARKHDGICKACKSATKRPQRHCLDCGTAVQQHVARCRACAAKTRTVRTEEDIRYGPEWQGQRARALRRAKRACRRCGKTSANASLNVHHIVPWRIDHDSGNENLAVLCTTCHGATHSRYRTLDCCTREDFVSAFDGFLATE